MPDSPRPQRAANRVPVWLAGIGVFAALVLLGAFAFDRHLRRSGGRALLGPVHLGTGFKREFTRPYGMAPVAFGAFVCACNAAKVHPWRVGQTIGDHPRSVGYHHRDGRLHGHDYCAAIDIGTWDLSRQQITRLNKALWKEGFAAFYRDGPKWKNVEHIHAVYAFLPMKPQLRGQVREFLRERRSAGTPIAWEKKYRRQKRRMERLYAAPLRGHPSRA